MDSLANHHPEPILSPHPSPLRDDVDARLPAAAYLRYRDRADGWSAGRQAACLAHLADNGVAADAVRSVGMSAQGSYALRRQARGYAFNLGWEAALIIARRIVADELMAAAIKGETACWIREDGKTTYTRQNTKLSLTLLDRVNPATAMPEVMAVAGRFDCFLQLIDDGATGVELWEYFFDEVLPHEEHRARARVRAALQLSEESAGFEDEETEEDDDEDDAPIEYKSMDGAPGEPTEIDSPGPEAASGHHTTTRRVDDCGMRISRSKPSVLLQGCNDKPAAPHVRPRRVVVSLGESKIPKVDAANQAAYLPIQARPGREAHFTNNAPPNLSLYNR